MSELFYGAVVGFTAAMLLCATVDAVARKFNGNQVRWLTGCTRVGAGDTLILRPAQILSGEQCTFIEAQLKKAGMKAVVLGAGLELVGLVKFDDGSKNRNQHSDDKFPLSAKEI